jgi:hypothetical protein
MRWKGTLRSLFDDVKFYHPNIRGEWFQVASTLAHNENTTLAASRFHALVSLEVPGPTISVFEATIIGQALNGFDTLRHGNDPQASYR